jgi:methylthioribose-1-phosphate isomerase
MLPATLTLHSDRVELLDQRVLPHRVEYVRCGRAEDVAAAIRTMVVRGAPAIGCAAACGVAVEAHRVKELRGDDFVAAVREGIKVLAASRPTAVNLFWALDRMDRTFAKAVSSASTPFTSSTVSTLFAEAHAIIAEDIAANKQLGAHGAALVPDGARILTHCNAGALATAGHGTALGVIRSARDIGKNVSVWVDETRPLLQGARLTAWELMQDGILATLITDNMAGDLMRRGKVDFIIVGADRVVANGDVANKIGTYSVAVLADRHNIPFYVACPESTIDRTIASGDAIMIEQRSREEVTGFGECQWAPEGVGVANPAFDVTPAELVWGVITERGVYGRGKGMGTGGSGSGTRGQ